MPKRKTIHQHLEDGTFVRVRHAKFLTPEQLRAYDAAGGGIAGCHAVLDMADQQAAGDDAHVEFLRNEFLQAHERYVAEGYKLLGGPGIEGTPPDEFDAQLARVNTAQASMFAAQRRYHEARGAVAA